MSGFRANLYHYLFSCRHIYTHEQYTKPHTFVSSLRTCFGSKNPFKTVSSSFLVLSSSGWDGERLRLNVIHLWCNVKHSLVPRLSLTCTHTCIMAIVALWVQTNDLCTWEVPSSFYYRCKGRLLYICTREPGDKARKNVYSTPVRKNYHVPLMIMICQYQCCFVCTLADVTVQGTSPR